MHKKQLKGMKISKNEYNLINFKRKMKLCILLCLTMILTFLGFVIVSVFSAYFSKCSTQKNLRDVWTEAVAKQFKTVSSIY